MGPIDPGVDFVQRERDGRERAWFRRLVRRQTGVRKRAEPTGGEGKYPGMDLHETHSFLSINKREQGRRK